MGEPALKIDNYKEFNEQFVEHLKLTKAMKDRLDKLDEKTIEGDETTKKMGKVFEDNVIVFNEYKDTLKKMEERQNKFEALANTTGKSVDELEEKRCEIAGMFDEWARKKHENESTFGFNLKDQKPELYALCVKEKYPSLSMEQIEKKGLSVDSDIDGGFLVQTLLMPIMKTRIFETSQVRAIAGSITISTDSVEWPIDDDEADSGGWVGEQQARPNTATPQLRHKLIFAREQFANPETTQKLLDDAAFPVENWLSGKISDILLRTENTAFVNGVGNIDPRGFMSYPAWAAPGVFEVNAIEQISSGAAAALTADGLIDLQIAPKEVYQTNATWVMNRRSFGAILKLKNGQGDYLWNRALDKNVQVPFDLLGRPVRFFDDMPIVAADALAIAYGDFKKAYMIVDRIGIRVIRDIFTNKPKIQLYTTKRVGGDMINFEALKIQKVEV